MGQTLNSISRMLPSAEFPAYTFTVGTETPHPFRDPRGHSFGQKRKASAPLDPERWADNRSFLLGIDYFNFGFYWEAHDEWDKLWRLTGADTTPGRFLKGLIKLAAAGVKVRECSIHGVRRHAASAGEVFADIAAESESDTYCGLIITNLQFAADRAAQLTYRTDMPVGRAVRVFPFTLIPEPTPFSKPV